ncbi:uncharacterized protein LTR77_000930 [Saxophila tyrrhenica]|uniref:Uncharacterized protein n=1 Tax=Saxophila tyrrhenica TaxID=1690608 RepID=A0AAV9PTW6_9PEZI|nr:hypothetical protein LTR77_000930 [Saxophila tyrrhenica]
MFSQSGDVEIVIATQDGRKENRYVLHRQTLCQCSGFFDASTRVEWSGRQGDGGGGGGLARINEVDSAVGGSSRASSQERRPSFQQQSGKRWRYVLDWKNVNDDDPPLLVQREHAAESLFGGGGDSRSASAHTRPPAASEGFFRNMRALVSSDDTRSQAGGSLVEPGEEVLKDYDNLFRTMYQRRPILDGVNIATAYTECKALLHLADMYDALDVVGDRVDHHLLCFGAKLFKQIARYPPSYLKLGYLARSQKIFSEALIHVVGQWPAAAPQLRNQVEAAVMDLIEDKAEELADLQARVESKLWRLTLTTSRGERVTPSNDFLSWLAMSLFRQWFAENTTPGISGILKPSSRPSSNSTQQPTRQASRSSNHIASQRLPAPAPTPASPAAPFSVGRVFLLLGSASPSTYLGHDETKRFLKLNPDLYTRDNLRRFERRVDELKHLARDAVKPLMRNFLELDLSSFGPGGLGYLTCTRVEGTDLPWDA